MAKVDYLNAVSGGEEVSNLTSPVVRRQIESKLREMKHELSQLQAVVRQLESAMKGSFNSLGTPPSLIGSMLDPFGMAGGKKVSAIRFADDIKAMTVVGNAKRTLRGWLVSLVESVGFLEGIMSYKNIKAYEFSNIVSRGGTLGVTRGYAAQWKH